METAGLNLSVCPAIKFGAAVSDIDALPGALPVTHGIRGKD
jgi:hypothetical protein